MNLTPCMYKVESNEDNTRLAQGMAWKPPAGHAGWCFTQRTPWERGSTMYYVLPRPSRACNCAKNPLARSLRKVFARRGAQPG